MLIALFTYSSICRADDAEGVLIWQTDGSCTTCQMDAKPVITYSGDSLLLTAENVDVKLPLEGIVNIVTTQSFLLAQLSSKVKVF